MPDESVATPTVATPTVRRAPTGPTPTAHRAVLELRSALVAFIVLTASVTQASPGNDDAFFLGDEAAVAGGAVVATTHDSGAVWYNPAGLGANDRNRLDLTSTAFQLRFERSPEFVEYSAGSLANFNALSTNEIQVVPTALVGMRRFGSFSAAFGVFVPLQDENDLSNPVRTGDETLGLSVENDLRSAAKRYQLAVAAGWQPHPRFRIGFSLQGVYETSTEYGRAVISLLADSPEEIGEAVLFLEANEERVRIALEATLGIQWEIVDHLHLGLVIRSPRIGLYDDDSYDELLLTGYRDDRDGMSSFSGVLREETAATEVSFERLYSAPRIYLGLGWKDEWGFVGVEADVRTGLPEGGTTGRARPQFNLRAGFDYQLTPKIALGAGIFTDRSGYALGDYPTQDVDFYGGTFGLRFDTPVRVIREEDDADEYPDLRFTTTLALRYAFGVGDIRGLYLRLDDTGLDAGGRVAGIQVHELNLHLGSGLVF